VAVTSGNTIRRIAEVLRIEIDKQPTGLVATRAEIHSPTGNDLHEIKSDDKVEASVAPRVREELEEALAIVALAIVSAIEEVSVPGVALVIEETQVSVRVVGLVTVAMSVEAMA